ncbi:MAG: helix-turn-helix transcriptional regulator [Actinobacteria bacterium]|nr:helix-turn-helix transcriptional regulator [Actinomycetota bacterium]MBI3686767.1 helix-turn-helix transcriptional regulator [Actinomycetota bacterium]
MRGNSTVRRRRLGRELASLRKQRGLTLRDVHQQTGIAMYTVSAYENGHTTVRELYVRALLDVYGVEPDVRMALVALGRGSSGRDWRHVYGDVIPEWFEVYVGLEQDATSARNFEIDLIPGLLQIPDYHRAINAAAIPRPPDDEVERRVAVRTERQKRVTEAGFTVWAVIDEAALRRWPADAAVARAQLHHLAELTGLPNVTVQVLPFGTGLHPAGLNSFMILGFADPADPDVVYVDSLTSGQYLESAAEVGSYTLVFDHLRAMALDPAASRTLLARLGTEI